MTDELFSLSDHLLRLRREDLNAQRDLVPMLLEQTDDLPDVIAKILPLLPGDQRRVRGDARHEAPFERLLDLGEVRRIDEDHHRGRIIAPDSGRTRIILRTAAPDGPSPIERAN